MHPLHGKKTVMLQRSVSQSVGWSVGRSVGRSVGQSVGGLVGRSDCRCSHCCILLASKYSRARVNVPGFGGFNITYTGMCSCDCEQSMVSVL